MVEISYFVFYYKTNSEHDDVADLGKIKKMFLKTFYGFFYILRTDLDRFRLKPIQDFQ